MLLNKMFNSWLAVKQASMLSSFIASIAFGVERQFMSKLLLVVVNYL